MSPFNDDLSGRPTAKVPERGERIRPGEPFLRIFGEGLSIVYPLPRSGSLTIGRGKTADLRIDDASISRQHATLHVGPAVELEDLESANGTWVGHVRLVPRQRMAVHPGDVIELGTVMIVIQPGDSASAPRRVLPDAPAWTRQEEESSPPKGSRASVVVADPAMQQLYRLVDRVAASDISVLLLGETGSGKEVMAEAIHTRSPRASKPLLRLNCAALSESLLESELFGHEKGAFTGADKSKPGLLETAEGGTVFLDEIGEMPATLQAKLLRVLEERMVTRVGGLRPKPIDVRFLSATHRDLGSESSRGRFRQDLFFRLNGISLVIPPLRERPGEIEALARAFLAAGLAAGAPEPTLSPAAIAELKAHPWPGNVRELRNVMGRALVLSGGSTIEPEHLKLEPPRPTQAPAGVPAPAPAPATPSVSAPVATPEGGPLSAAIDALEKQRILDALERCAGNQSRAAKMLGISRGTLLSRLDAFGIARPRKPQS
ncbi:sigma 54-interacting transcriptional regulator [Hyalangium sp.]|uniref:sigma 54-interacting transcriptional regulator n=1 Tax=Hyalangium sp. TaxID=2028555 RepID=UPI002D5903CC|nr:sigma 54-interacting transcriptional regulator [Hyalangium sp.]HYH99387.1 sigma 54-interacting transcriptional regulator [Hyalangium sp.]